jgi:Adenylate and Guanylate cyclase catalytic domain
MAYFGWPEAHNNDGERAARAGLAILEAISKLNDESARPKLTARVGVDSGPVVVGAGAGNEADVFGDTPNIAARLQATAAPGTVVLTEATHLLISGLFVVEASGPHILKGIAASPEVFQVVTSDRGPREARTARGLTPFVGREEELRLLLNRWQRIRARSILASRQSVKHRAKPSSRRSSGPLRAIATSRRQELSPRHQSCRPRDVDQSLGISSWVL